MTDKSNTTTASATITENGDNAEITIPTAGYYDTTSKISVPIETIKNNVESINEIGRKILTGKYSKSFTVDISAYFSNYSNLTSDNFIISIEKNYNNSNTIHISTSGYVDWIEGYAYTSSISKTYDSSTGLLTISGLPYTTIFYSNGSTIPGTTVYQYVDISIYYISV